LRHAAEGRCRISCPCEGEVDEGEVDEAAPVAAQHLADMAEVPGQGLPGREAPVDRADANPGGARHLGHPDLDSSYAGPSRP
jgi:hypothetical protein